LSDLRARPTCAPSTTWAGAGGPLFTLCRIRLFDKLRRATPMQTDRKQQTQSRVSAPNLTRQSPFVNRRTPLLLLIIMTAGTAHGLMQTNVEYGIASGEKLLFDAWVPEGRGPFPAVILVHGGAWTTGDKSGGPDRGYMAPMHEPLAHAGFAWFSINYRLAPTHRYPACIEDVETAIRCLKTHATEYRVDPQRIALAGESAGGHLVALSAVRATSSTRVAAVVAFYTPFDLGCDQPDGAPLTPTMQALLGRKIFDRDTAVLIREASPLTQVKSNLPPFLLLHGDADTRVPHRQSLNMQSRLRDAGVTCELITIPAGGHGMRRWEPLAPDFKARVIEWLKRTLHVPPASTGPARLESPQSAQGSRSR
jgi:acetyl esterase/lipase